jgi:hypothetical protein
MYPTIPAPYVQLPPPTASNVALIDMQQPAVGRVPSSIVPPPIPANRDNNTPKQPHHDARQSRFEHASLKATSSFMAQLLTEGKQDGSVMHYGFIRPLPSTSAEQPATTKLKKIVEEQESLFEESPEQEEVSPALILHHLLEHMGHLPPASKGVYAIDSQNENNNFQDEAYHAYAQNDARIAYHQSLKPGNLQFDI